MILRRMLFIVCVLLSVVGQTFGGPQTQSLQDLKQQALRLTEEQRYTDALPLLREWIALEPDNAGAHYLLGFAWLAQANNVLDDAEKNTLRKRGREAFVKSLELGNTRPGLDALILSIPPDGSSNSRFSENPEAQAWMVEAEAFFGQGKLQDALRDYQRALQADPGLYEAALFSGDVYLKDSDYSQAEKWYQKAIEINPNRETAYRYSATPFMRQSRPREALPRYVEAYITEPYSGFSQSGLVQWANATRTRVGHPAIVVPVEVTVSPTGDTKIEIDAVIALTEDDGSSAWISYGAVRSEWAKKKFAETFPQEKSYRHTLAEEAEALRMVLATAKAFRIKTLSSSLILLKKLDDDGLLEAYILIARPDEGISDDHAAYLKDNREKLRRYVLNYMIEGGGK